MYVHIQTDEDGTIYTYAIFDEIIKETPEVLTQKGHKVHYIENKEDIPAPEFQQQIKYYYEHGYRYIDGKFLAPLEEVELKKELNDINAIILNILQQQQLEEFTGTPYIPNTELPDSDQLKVRRNEIIDKLVEIRKR